MGRELERKRREKEIVVAHASTSTTTFFLFLFSHYVLFGGGEGWKRLERERESERRVEREDG